MWQICNCCVTFSDIHVWKHCWRLLKPAPPKAPCGGVAPLALVLPMSLVNNSFCNSKWTHTRQINYNLYWKMETLGWLETGTEIAALGKWWATNMTKGFQQWAVVERTMKPWWMGHKYLMRNDEQVMTGLCLTKIQTFFSQRLRNEIRGLSAFQMSRLGSWRLSQRVHNSANTKRSSKSLLQPS